MTLTGENLGSSSSRRGRVIGAEEDGETVTIIAHDDNFGVGRAGEHLCRLDALPLEQLGRDALADNLLKVCNTLCLNRLALTLLPLLGEDILHALRLLLRLRLELDALRQVLGELDALEQHVDDDNPHRRQLALQLRLDGVLDEAAAAGIQRLGGALGREAAHGGRGLGLEEELDVVGADLRVELGGVGGVDAEEDCGVELDGETLFRRDDVLLLEELGLRVEDLEVRDDGRAQVPAGGEGLDDAEGDDDADAARLDDEEGGGDDDAEDDGEDDADGAEYFQPPVVVVVVVGEGRWRERVVDKGSGTIGAGHLKWRRPRFGKGGMWGL